jgi:hypothetical protein
MFNYIKKFWETLAGAFLLGVALAIFCWNPPWQFFVSLAVFAFLLNAVVEQAKAHGGAAFDLIKKVWTVTVGVLVFVGLRAIAGYFLDMPASQSYQEIARGNDILGLHVGQMATNVVIELLFLVPGVAIAHLIVKEGKFWKTALTLVCAALLVWVVWSVKQKTHAQAIRAETQARVNLDARRRSDHALAIATCFGIAREDVRLFYTWDGTNITRKLGVTNLVVQSDERVLRLNPDQTNVFFQGQAFTEVMIANANGSFIDGTKVWVESWKFDWTDGKVAPTPAPSPAKATTPTVGPTLPGITLEIGLTNGQVLTVKDDLRQGQSWRYLSFVGAFSHRIDKGDGQACWKLVQNNLPWNADYAGQLQVKAGDTPVKLTVNIAP